MAGIYVHIPFCEHKCIYCDFYSLDDHSAKESFLSAMTREIEMRYSEWRDEPVETVYFGGGTPSVLRADELGSILDNIRERFALSEEAEITVEVNPGTVDGKIFERYLSRGINRVSIGVQSPRDEDLRFLTRVHDAGEAIRSVEDARIAGFKNLSIDLIYGLPTQSPDDWNAIMRKGISMAPDHISAYHLTVEERTPLAGMVRSGAVKIPREAVASEMFLRTMEVMKEAGYGHYEVSNYSIPGMESKHNRNYWRHTPYLGLGPSAHSFKGKIRSWNHPSVENYAADIASGKLPLSGSESLSDRQFLIESIMFQLRMGFLDLDELFRSEKIDRKGSLGLADALEDQKLTEKARPVLRLTERGFLLCDEIIQKFTCMVVE